MAGKRKGAVLSAEALLHADPESVQSGVAIRGVEYADDHRTASGKLVTPIRVERLDPVELELSYRRSALVFKGVNQKARDAFKAGFEVIPDTGDLTARKTANLRVHEWMRRHKFRPKAERAIREGYWAGDGFLELIYPGLPTLPAPGGVEPTKVKNVNPFLMRPVIDHRVTSPTRGDVIWYWYGKDVRKIPVTQVQRWVEGGELPKEVGGVLHPSRVAHFQPYPLPESAEGELDDGLGLSVIEAAYINVLSKTAGDRSLGDILEWAGQGFFIVNVDFATEEELKKTAKMVEASKKARKTFFVGSERTKFETAEPVVPNVESFYKQFYVEIAAALEMPTMILMGVQKGTVSGSSVDIVQYYDDVRAFQEAHVEPVLHPLLSRILNTDAFRIRWTPLYVDKETEANLRFKGMQSAVAGFGAGLLTKRQSIEYLRSGELPDPETVPDEYIAVPMPTKVSDSPEGGRPTRPGVDGAGDDD